MSIFLATQEIVLGYQYQILAGQKEKVQNPLDELVKNGLITLRMGGLSFNEAMLAKQC
jgi:hypothetical protein